MTDQTRLTDSQYARIEPWLPARGNHVKIFHRQVLDAWLYVYYQGCTWRGLPREFGDWHTIYVRLNRWAKAGVLERVARALQQELLAELDLDTLSLDSTIIPVHAHGSAHCEKGSQAIGRSLGGLTTKLHALVANDRVPLIIGLSPGQRHDAPWGRELLRRLGPASNHPYLVMDRAHEDDATRRLAAQLGYHPFVPPKSNRRRPWTYDRTRYRRRNEVERFFCRLKRFRRIAFRSDKLDQIYLAAVHLVLSYDMLLAM